MVIEFLTPQFSLLQVSSEKFFFNGLWVQQVSLNRAPLDVAPRASASRSCWPADGSSAAQA